MPTYGYECTLCRAQFEVQQRITDEPLTVHDGCGGSLKRLVYPVGIMFKGPGFHVNDYAPKRNGKDSSKNGSSAESCPSCSVSSDSKSACGISGGCSD